MTRTRPQSRRHSPDRRRSRISLINWLCVHVWSRGTQRTHTSGLENDTVRCLCAFPDKSFLNSACISKPTSLALSKERRCASARRTEALIPRGCPSSAPEPKQWWSPWPAWWSQACQGKRNVVSTTWSLNSAHPASKTVRQDREKTKQIFTINRAECTRRIFMGLGVFC